MFFFGSKPQENTAHGVQIPQISRNPASRNPVWYVSPSGNNSGYGEDSSRPLASVEAALTRIKAAYWSGKWPAGKSAVIVINGTITASGSFGPNQAMIDISGAGNYPPIILEGGPVKKGVLNANRSRANEGRVLYIANNTVTLGKNLTLTGGYALRGGAVCVGAHGTASRGEFIMTGGEISGNTASLGGGVLLYKGNMTMTGGEIKNNTATKNYSGVMGTGGGVYVGEGNTFTMSGGTISGNTSAADGGVYVSPQGGIFKQSGGTVSKNKP